MNILSNISSKALKSNSVEFKVLGILKKLIPGARKDEATVNDTKDKKVKIVSYRDVQVIISDGMVTEIVGADKSLQKKIIAEIDENDIPNTL